jgi:methylmalonyl-CoA mutase
VLQGTLCIPPEKGFDYLYSLTSSLKELPAFRAIHCNASNFYNAGADMVQELAFSISMGAEYIAQLTSRGMDPGYAASKIRFSFGTGSHYFPEIAKLRAARLLWSAVMNGFIPGNTDAAKMVIHSVTGRWNKTIFDPYVNLLRTQTEAMSSVTGGADSITVEPFDKVFRQPDDFSERIARNQQLILKEESCFDRVADPASGSYYIENLTHNLADKAWKLFIETEEEGGFLEALRKGSVQQMIRKTAEIKRSDISKRKTIFLGTNKYPAGEPLPQMSDPERLSGENLITDENIIEPLQLFRGPEIFEQLRMDVEEAARRPVVFLIPVGDPVMRKARAKFSSEFFGCAGYRVIEVRDFNTSEEGAREAVDSGADIVVICSSDEEYSVYGPEISGILRNKAIIVIAGNPASADDLKNEGIEHFISLKSDTAATLRDFNVRLGVNMGI